ncbi:MAG TPA: hypothetical protein IAC04_02840 [Candidatus Coprenecus stercoravium]|uniref:SPOR domain-containing protein n=1 Tax=Candidatus Coprenecus stercoravium TaxID=2840735 RepID=A0A9D2GNN2_9BACT|nr:hypothetical protein [Candidatus Coprenecus stercoravium]
MRKVRILIVLLPVLMISGMLQAQELPSDTLTAETQDSVVAVTYMTYDSLMTYLGSSVGMSDSLSVAMMRQIEKNKARTAQGYRIRIYFDNSQDARMISEQIVDTFAVHYPDVPVYRIYDNPYFKVTVGEFRSKADAMRFLEAIRPEYPTVFLVKESFSTI